MQGTLFYFVVICLALFGAGNCQINWSSITATQLGNLPANAFSTITASRIASIPSQACSGFKSNQVLVIPPTSMAGFTAQCIAVSMASNFANVFPEQIAAVPVNAFEGFTVPQLEAMSCATLQAISTAQANALQPTVKTQFEKELGQCPAISSFIQQPIAPLPSGIDWSNITAKQLLDLPPSDFVNITAGQLASIPDSSCSGFQPDQIAAIPPTSMSGLRADQFLNFNPSACSGFTLAQIRKFDNELGKTMQAGCLMNLQPSTCRGLTEQFLFNMPVKTFSGFTNSCITNTFFSAFELVTPEQLGAINSTSCSGFRQKHMPYIESGSKLTAACLNSFDTNAPNDTSPCYGIQTKFFGSIMPASFYGFTAQCFNQMDYAVFSALKRTQLAAVNPDSCAGFTDDQVSSIPFTAALGMVYTCLQNMNTSCAGLKATFIGDMTPSACGGFTAECIAKTAENAFKYLQPTQIVRIPPAAFAGFNQQLRYIPDETIAAVMLSQLLNLSPVNSNLGGMTAAQLANVTNTYKANLINKWTTDQTSKYPMADAYDFKQMIPGTVAPTTDWNFVLTSLVNTTWLQVALIKDLPAKFPLDFLQEMPPSAIMGVRSDEVGIIPAAAFSFLPEVHAGFLLNDTTSAVVADQLVQIGDRVFGYISNMGISGLSVSVIPNITTAQANNIRISQIQAMSCNQLKAITNDQANALRSSTNEVYNQELVDCNNGTPFAPVGEPIAPPGAAPVEPPGIKAPVNSPSHNVTLTPSAPSEDLSRIYIIAITCGAGAVILVVIIGLIIWCNKRSKDPERRGLLANPNEVRYERA